MQISSQIVTINFFMVHQKTTFNQFYSNYTCDLKPVKDQHSAELDIYIWQLKNNNFSYNVKW